MINGQEILENKFVFAPIDYRLELYCKDLTYKKDSLDFSRMMRLEFYEKEFIQKDHAYFKDKEIGLNPIKAEELFPEMFYKTKDFIPNVYSKTSKVSYSGNGFVEILLPTDHILKEGDTVLIYDDNKIGTKLRVEKKPSDKSFIIKDRLPKSDNYFVFGTLVQDYKELHYQELIILNLRVSQMLNDKIELLNKEMNALEQENKRMQVKIKELETKYKRL